jgi:hypothetical protein
MKSQHRLYEKKNSLQKLTKTPGKQITVDIKTSKLEGGWVIHTTLRGGLDCADMNCN